jgi:hypothetical protein
MKFFSATVSALLLGSAAAFVPTTVPVHQVSSFMSGLLHENETFQL